MTKQPFLVIALAALVAVGALVFGIAQSPANSAKAPWSILGGKAKFSTPVSNGAQPSGVTKNGMALLAELDDTLAGISEEAARSVVSISNGQGSGSGFIYRSDGWIVTNDHVVGNADEVQVLLPDGRTMKGKVTHSNDAQLDLAVVKIPATDLVALPMADSDTVRVGEFSIAVGSPFGLDDTVTIGHVSALGRGSMVNDPNAQVSRGYSGLIQTDASINPGNSGGPLLNIHGEVIGVNSTIVSTTMASAGIGFSIPSNVVRAVADELIANGKFDRGVLGAFIRDLKPFEKKDLKLGGGAMIDDVVGTSAAGKAGIKKGDVVVAFNGTEINSELGLRIDLYKAAPGDSVTVAYIRDGSRRETQLKLDEPEKQTLAQNFPQGANPFPFGNGGGENNGDGFATPQLPQGPVRLGIGIRELDETSRSQFSLPKDATGLVITSVDPGGFADGIGAKPGDLLVELNGEPISKLSDVRSVLDQVTWGDRVTIVLNRYENGAMTRIMQTRRIR